MNRFVKSTLMVIAVFCLFLYQYLVGGAGLQVFGFFCPVSSMTVLFGLVHFVGFVTAACLCFIIGAGLFAHGVVPSQEQRREEEGLRDEIDDA